MDAHQRAQENPANPAPSMVSCTARSRCVRVAAGRSSKCQTAWSAVLSSAFSPPSARGAWSSTADVSASPPSFLESSAAGASRHSHGSRAVLLERCTEHRLPSGIDGRLAYHLVPFGARGESSLDWPPGTPPRFFFKRHIGERSLGLAVRNDADAATQGEGHGAGDEAGVDGFLHGVPP